MRPTSQMMLDMRLSWDIPCLDHPRGDVEVLRSRAAVAEVIQQTLPKVQVRADWLTFVPLGDGRVQVNVSGFGPFGVLQEFASPLPIDS